MTSPRAPYGNGQIGSSLFLAQRDDPVQELREALQERLGDCGTEEKLADLRIAAGKRPQLVDEMGAREEPGVKDQIGIKRKALLVAERDQREGDPGRRALGKKCL